MTAAAPVSIASGTNCRAAGPPAMFHRQYSAAHLGALRSGQLTLAQLP